MRTLMLALIAGLSVARCAENLSPETLLPGHELTDASKPAMAFGDGVYLLVWQTDRNEKADIVGLRLDGRGTPLDPKPFIITAAPDAQECPRVAFGGGVFLVVWHDLRNGTAQPELRPPGGKDWDVFAARVRPDGKLLDPAGIAVADGERNQCEPGLCWDGKAFQVLWRAFEEKDSTWDVNRRADAGYLVHGDRVSSEGQRLDGAGVFMAKPPKEYLTPRSMGVPAAMALPDGTLIAAARSGIKQCLWRIKEGKPSGEAALMPKCDGFDAPAFATDGKTALVVWTTFRDGGGRSSGADKSGMMLLNADGAPAWPGARSLSSAAREPRVRHPAPAWDGKRYVVAWDVPRRIRGSASEAVLLRCFASDGAPLGDDDPVGDDADSPAYWPAVASDGKGVALIAYERHPKTADTPIRIGLRLLRVPAAQPAPAGPGLLTGLSVPLRVQ